MAYFSNGSERGVLDEQCEDCHITARIMLDAIDKNN